MQKTPPAFLFYPDNFMGGTMGWDYDQVGRYITLLILQWNGGPINPKIFRKISGKNAFSNLESKFKKTELGYVNERLELERERCLNSSSKQTERIKKRWQKTDTAVLPRYNHGNTAVIPLNVNVNRKDDEISGPPIDNPPDFKAPPPDLMSVPDITLRLKNDDPWLMVTISAIRKPGYKWESQWLKSMLDKFEAHLLTEGITEKGLRDYKRHFREWMKYQVQPPPINNEVY